MFYSIVCDVTAVNINSLYSIMCDVAVVNINSLHSIVCDVSAVNINSYWWQYKTIKHHFQSVCG